LVTFTTIAIGFSIYSWTSTHYLESTTAFIVIFGTSLISFEGYLLFSEIPFLYLLIYYSISVVFGFYLNFDVRNIIRSGGNTKVDENYVTGSLKIYVEILLVAFRLLELLGKSFKSSK